MDEPWIKAGEEAALLDAFRRTTPERTRDFAAELVRHHAADRQTQQAQQPQQAKHPRLLLAVLIGLGVLLFGLLLRPASLSETPSVVTAAEPETAPGPRATLPFQVAPPICVEVRRKDLERRLQRQRQRLKIRTPKLPS